MTVGNGKADLKVKSAVAAMDNKFNSDNNIGEGDVVMKDGSKYLDSLSIHFNFNSMLLKKYCEVGVHAVEVEPSSQQAGPL